MACEDECRSPVTIGSFSACWLQAKKLRATNHGGRVRMYKVGDWIIYGKAGVCHVAED